MDVLWHNFNGRKIGIISIYFFWPNFDGQKFDIVSMCFLDVISIEDWCNFDVLLLMWQKIVVERLFLEENSFWCTFSEYFCSREKYIRWLWWVYTSWYLIWSYLLAFTGFLSKFVLKHFWKSFEDGSIFSKLQTYGNICSGFLLLITWLNNSK